MMKGSRKSQPEYGWHPMDWSLEEIKGESAVRSSVRKYGRCFPFSACFPPRCDLLIHIFLPWWAQPFETTSKVNTSSFSSFSHIFGDGNDKGNQCERWQQGRLFSVTTWGPQTFETGFKKEFGRVHRYKLEKSQDTLSRTRWVILNAEVQNVNTQAKSKDYTWEQGLCWSTV